MLFAKSSNLNLSFIPFSSHNPDQWIGGATGLTSLLTSTQINNEYKSDDEVFFPWRIIDWIKIMSYQEQYFQINFFFKSLLILIFIGMYFKNIIFNLNSSFNSCTYTSINLQDNDVNPIKITIIIIQISIDSKVSFIA